MSTGHPGTASPAVVVFAFRRPDHLQRTVESLLANPEVAELPLIVYCDAAKRPEDHAAVEAVRAYAHGIAGFSSVRIVERKQNYGLARSIISGVTEILEQHDSLIVLEDDLLLSRHFVRYMMDGLNIYAGDAKVASIHGYVYPVRDPVPETFFLKGADCWGWATWRRAWEQFRPEGAGLLAELQARGLARVFDFDGSYPFTRMLQDQISGRNDSWAIRWNASCFLADMLTLYPGRSLVHNIGNDATGTHGGDRTDHTQSLAQDPLCVQRLALEESTQGRAAFVRFFRSIRGRPWHRAMRLLRRMLKS